MLKIKRKQETERLDDGCKDFPDEQGASGSAIRNNNLAAPPQPNRLQILECNLTPITRLESSNNIMVIIFLATTESKVSTHVQSRDCKHAQKRNCMKTNLILIAGVLII